jgi:hypothetical protein
MNAPGDTWWPLPGLILLEIVLLALAGLAGEVAERGPGSTRWHSAPWVASGALVALGAVGWFGFSVIVFALVPAFLFGMAAVLADWRRRRSLAQGLGTWALSAGINAAVVVALIGWTRA